jgi:hypothetical protein
MAFASKMAVKAQAGKKTVKETSDSFKNKRWKAEKADASSEASENDELKGSEVFSEGGKRRYWRHGSQLKTRAGKKGPAPFSEVTLSIFDFCSFTCNDYVCPLTGGYDWRRTLKMVVWQE